MNLQTIFRVQAKDGRGPYRPGYSKLWVDFRKDLPNPPPTWGMEWPDLQPELVDLCRRGFHVGCGVREISGLAKWFLPTEREKLMGLGFFACQMKGEIVRESESQIVFARRIPLSKGYTRVEWPKD